MALTPKEQEELLSLLEQEEQYNAKNTLVDFRNYYISGGDDVEAAPFHYKWSDILLNQTNNFAIEGYRESAKSQHVIRGHVLYRLRYPSKSYDYIVFILQNQRKAGNKLDEIANEYLANPKLSSNLVKIIRQSKEVFEVEVRDEQGEIINVRIEAFGKGGSVRGLVYGDRRPKLVILDDPQDLEDSESETVLEGDWNWFLSDVKFLGEKTRIFLIGNNLGEKCIVERVIKDAKHLNFETMVVPAIDDAFITPTWEARNTAEQIKAERESFSALGKLEIWYREKMCKAMAPEDQIFKREYFKYYNHDMLKTGGFNVYILIDPSASLKEKADFRAIVVLGVNSENHWFVLDIKYGRFTVFEFIDNIFNVVVEHKPRLVGFEKEKLKDVYDQLLNAEMVKRNIFFRIEELKAEKKKEIRIEAMQPRFKTGTVWFPEGANFLPELESELLMFPKGAYDDLIDALAYGEQVAKPPTRKATTITVNTSYNPFKRK